MYIILFIVIIMLCLWSFFNSLNKKSKHQFNLCFDQLNKIITRHKQEIEFRNANLNHYHFLEYNLKDALVPQWQIKI